jgi:hypothetical protein
MKPAIKIPDWLSYTLKLSLFIPRFAEEVKLSK